MHLNLIAILAATLVSYGLGSLWYVVLGKTWRRAVGWEETVPAYRPRPVELGVAFLGQLVIATALSGLLAHRGGATLRTGVITGALAWLGFVLPTLSTNVIFQRRNLSLIWQDGLHWLLILVSQGAVLGLFGG